MAKWRRATKKAYQIKAMDEIDGHLVESVETLEDGTTSVCMSNGARYHFPYDADVTVLAFDMF